MAANFDLAVCGTPTSTRVPTCMWVSEGGDETNEGFDITLEENFSDVRAFLIMPGSWTACSDGEGESSASEELWWATVWNG